MIEALLSPHTAQTRVRMGSACEHRSPQRIPAMEFTRQSFFRIEEFSFAFSISHLPNFPLTKFASGSQIRLMMEATYPAPKPLSMLTTLTLDAQEFNMPCSA